MSDSEVKAVVAGNPAKEINQRVMVHEETIDLGSSIKIQWLEVLAVTMVIVIHSRLVIGEWFIPLITQWATPFFFVMSGMFFSSSIRKHNTIMLFQRKVFSLIVPYFVWAVWGAALVGFVDVHALGIIDTYPSGNSPLWFIRALVIMMGFVIVIDQVLSFIVDKHVRRIVVGAIGFTSIVLLNGHIPLILMPSAPFYFMAGYIFSMAITRWRLHWVLVACSLLAAIATRILSVDGWGLMRHLSNIFMMVFLWFGYDLILQRRKFHVPSFLKHTFGVYCIHMPLLCLIGGSIPAWVLAIIFPACCFLLIGLLYRLAPQVCKFLFGGR